jgi:hypothetical protein
MSEEIDIFHHKELQELAIHYKTLNWTLHAIFVPMHVGLIGFLATASLSERHPPPSAVEFGVFGCISGLVLLWAWRVISNRQRDITARLYGRLHELERHMSSTYPENPQGFDVHLVVDSYDKATWLTIFTPKTRTIFTLLRFFMLVAYLFLSYSIFFDGRDRPLEKYVGSVLQRWTTSITSPNPGARAK